jgi:RES domain-containing protein
MPQPIDSADGSDALTASSVASSSTDQPPIRYRPVWAPAARTGRPNAQKRSRSSAGITIPTILIIGELGAAKEFPPPVRPAIRSRKKSS